MGIISKRRHGPLDIDKPSPGISCMIQVWVKLSLFRFECIHPRSSTSRKSSLKPASKIQRLWHEPRCRALSRQRYSISSSTIYTMNRMRSNRAASSTDHGFRGHENTFSLMSDSTSEKTPSNGGRRPFRILPTLPLTTRAVSAFTVLQRLLLQIRTWVV